MDQQKWDMICYDSNSVSFRALFNSRKNWVKTSFLKDELSSCSTTLQTSFSFINVFLKHSYVSTRSIHFYTHTFLSILAFILISSHKYLFLFIVRYIPFDPDLSLCPLSCGLWSPLVLVFYFTVCCLTSKSYPIGCYPPLKVVFYFLSLSAITFLFALYMFLWTVLYGFY